jgi:5-methylcytosine-specific restriction endonuclease McrA
VQDAAPSARPRWLRKNAKRRPDTRARAAWGRLRLQVLAEERDCWVCGDEIDAALRWPHPMCGTGDHVVPLEDGGELLDRANVRAAHRACNQRRHVEWRRARRRAAREAA